jgi:CBS-domain-containing membrane protein
MITDRDICMAAFLQGRPLAEIPIKSAMSPKVVATRPEDSLGQAEEKMQQGSVRRLPVVDGSGKLKGIVSISDIARECVTTSAKKKISDAALTPEALTATFTAIVTPRKSLAGSETQRSAS